MTHVIPVQDIKPHMPLSTCECGPRYDPEYDMLIHDAFEDYGQHWTLASGGDFKYVENEKNND